MIIRYLDVDVFRSPDGDFSNNGVSSRFRELAVACPDGIWSFDSEKELPLNFCMIEYRPYIDHFDIVPAMVEDGKIVKRPGGWMSGGNIAYTCDSRFHAMKGNHYPLQILDKIEK